MKSAMIAALCLISVAVVVSGQRHPRCRTDAQCVRHPRFTCTTPGDRPFCHNNECHCHQEEECGRDSDCFHECGLQATCDRGHCHGDCHHW